MDTNEVRQEVQEVVSRLPRWKLYCFGAVLLFALIYLAWTIWGPRLQKPGQGFKPMKAAVSGKKRPGPQVQIQVVPKSEVKDEFPDAAITELEEFVDTAEVPPAPNGATVLTKIDTATGETTSQVEMKRPPWFALERNNTLGAGYEIGTQGAKIPIYYRRDILRVKDVHLVGEVGAKIALDPTEKSEGHATALMEFRF